MRIAVSVGYLFRNLPIMVFAPSSLASLSGQKSKSFFLLRLRDIDRNWPALRLLTLLRDRSRCRGCDRQGGEVTLCIRLIRPNVAGLDAMLTLCMECEELVNQRGLQGDTIPDFLRHLWHCIHHAEREGRRQDALKSEARQRSSVGG